MNDEHTKSIVVGRYLLHRQIARGGMATIHIARLVGDEGFSRIVAAKRLLPELAEDTEFVAMFMDEARVASKVNHPNVVPVLDLVTTADEVMLVQDYVHGVPLHVLLRTAHETSTRIPIRVAVSIAAQILAGLQAAHTTTDEIGTPLNIVHRDVSPQNVMIALDGSARLLDFGVAKTTIASHVSRSGTFKGKLAYAAPEQVRGQPVQQSDVYALAVVLWELLVGHRMHSSARSEAELIGAILDGKIETLTDALSNEADWGAITSDDWRVLSELEPIVRQGLAVDISARYQSAAEMADALTQCVAPATAAEVAAWVKKLGKDFIESRDRVIAEEETSWRRSLPITAPPVSSVVAALPVPAPEVPPAAVRRMPMARTNSGAKLIASVLGVLIVLLGVGVVFAVSSDDSPAASPSPSASATTREAPRVAQPALHEPSPAPAAVVPQREAAPEPQPEPVAAATPTRVDEDTATEVTAKPMPRGVAKPVRRAIAPKAQPEADPEPEPLPDAVPPPPPPAQPAVSCDPPYYYQGQKKVFKPQCL